MHNYEHCFQVHPGHYDFSLLSSQSRNFYVLVETHQRNFRNVKESGKKIIIRRQEKLSVQQIQIRIQKRRQLDLITKDNLILYNLIYFECIKTEEQIFVKGIACMRARKEEIKKLEDENRKMEEQLERVRKLREIQLEKEKLRLQMESLKMQEKQPNPKKQTKKPKNLRNYASNVTAENYQRAIKKVQKIKIEVSSGSQEDDKDSENLKYFLNVLGMSHYYDKLVTHEIHTLPKLRQVGEKQAKQMGIPLKDMIKINKKLRTMGI